MKTKHFIVLTAILLAAALLAACGGSSGAAKSDYEYAAETSAAPIYEGAIIPGEGGYGGAVDVNFYEEAETATETYREDNAAKIIYTASVEMQSTEFDTALSGIDSKVASISGAYFEDRNVSSYNTGYRSAYMTIRVPAKEIGSFVESLHDIATVTSESQNARDVSDSYYDTEARLKTARTKLERLQKLLADADSMETIIQLEEAISDTEYEIDDLQGTLKHLDSRIEYSTVDVILSEVTKVETVETPITFGERISAAFKNGLTSFINGMENIAIWFARSWSTLLLLALIFVVPGIIVIAVTTKHKKKMLRAERGKEQEENTKEEKK